MTLFDTLEAVGFVVVAAQTGWIVLLHRRLGLLRTTLAGAQQVVEQMDAAAKRLDESSGTALAAVKEKLAELDRKTAAAGAKLQEIDSVTRKGQAAADRLERALRNGRGRIPAPAGPMPREQVEPLGFAEHMMARGAAQVSEEDAPAELLQRILAAQMQHAVPAADTPRGEP